MEYAVAVQIPVAQGQRQAILLAAVAAVRPGRATAVVVDQMQHARLPMRLAQAQRLVLLCAANLTLARLIM